MVKMLLRDAKSWKDKAQQHLRPLISMIPKLAKLWVGGDGGEG